jgi:hypothetical protein
LGFFIWGFKMSNAFSSFVRHKYIPMNRRQSLVLLLQSTFGAALLPQNLWAQTSLNNQKPDHLLFFEAFAAQLLGNYYQGDTSSYTMGVATACFIQNCLTAPAQNTLTHGIEKLQAFCQQQYEGAFETLPNTEQHQVMTQLFDSKQTVFAKAFAFAKQLRAIQLFEFFNSEYGATQVLEYLPVPGGYQGKIDRKTNNRLWTH